MENKPSEENLQKTNNENIVGNTFLEFITITVKYRWFLFWFVFIITAGATAFALLSPKWYKSTASVLPAEKTDLLSSLSGLSSLVKGFSPSRGLAALTGSTEFDKYIAILKSTTLADDVIDRFGLKKEYDLEDSYHEKIIKEFFSNLDIEIADEGNLVINFFDKDPQRAADVVNYMIDQLNIINTRLSVFNAKFNREFIEKRYNQNVNDINNLETKMMEFQEKYGVIAVPEQIESTIKTMAAIYSDYLKKEIEFNVLRRTYGESSPLVQKAKIGVEEILKKINSLKYGSDISKNDIKLLIPFKQAPELGKKYLKIYRDIEIQYKILEFVQPMFEQAKVEEIRNTPSVLVLDKAVPADRKSKPKGSLYAILAFVISLTIGFIIIICLEAIQKMKHTDKNSFDYIKNSLKSDFRKITFSRKK
ncbi:MAG: hypothetical protein IH949_05210 [Bacteroidetes bacterium]|nr:hypothetical protein [Bacteroidota bacterium]